MDNNETFERQFRQFAESKLDNHLSELNTRYENERLGSEELKRQAYYDHKKIFEQELDEKITSFLQQENSDWVKGELQNIKHDYLERLISNND